MRLRACSITSAIAAICLLAFVLAIGSLPAAAVDVHGDDVADQFVGSGAIILGAGSNDSVRREAAGCTDCHWRLQSLCADVGLGVGAVSRCGTDLLWCSGDDRLRHLYLAIGAGPYIDRGFACVGPAGPVAVAEVSRQVHESIASQLPRVALTAQPPRGVLTQLPVQFDSGQRISSASFDYVIAGVRVRGQAQAVRHWDFGDGQQAHGLLPGGRYPTSDVLHVYRRPGPRQVHLQVTWRASFTADGLGPFDVPEPVEQSAWTQVQVGEGRAVLSGGRSARAPTGVPD